MNPVEGVTQVASKLTSQEFILAVVVLLIFLIFFYIGSRVYSSLLAKRDEALKDLAVEVKAHNISIMTVAKVQDVDIQMTQKNRDLLGEILQALTRLELAQNLCRQECSMRERMRP
jgi:hypothetical protein